MSKQINLTDTKPPQPKKETPTNIPAALTHDQGPPKITIPTQPIPPKNPTPKPTPTPQQQKPNNPMPKETKILCDLFEEIEGALYHARETLYQQYGSVDYNYITDIELKFTTQQANKLSFEQKDNYWIIKPKVYLGGDMFAQIAETIKNLGGEYISAGRESHFRVKRQ
jgi:hypothetical protein